MNSPAEIWSSFTRDPRLPENAALRAADTDRAAIHQVLTEAYADGRLDRDEFDVRADGVTAARTLGELPPLVSDLVLTAPTASRSLLGDDFQTQAVEHWRRSRNAAVWRFLTPSLICWTIWLIGSVGAGGFDPDFPWPIFVSLGTGLPLIRIQTNRTEVVTDRVRKLEKKQRLALEQPQPGDQA